jgi:hypothetical protein
MVQAGPRRGLRSSVDLGQRENRSWLRPHEISIDPHGKFVYCIRYFDSGQGRSFERAKEEN